MGLFERLARLQQEKKNRAPEPASEASPQPLMPAEILGGEEIKITEGSFCLRRQYFNLEWPLSPAPDLIWANLQLVWGIGPVTAGQLNAAGIATVDQLSAHPRFGPDACTVQELIASKNISELRRRGAGDLELMGLFSAAEAIFLDIETTGLWSSQPLFLVGLMKQQGPNLVLDQLLARHYCEEQALLAYLSELLQEIKVLISFNGKRFDWPYLQDRLRYYKLPIPAELLQVDLYSQARRLPQRLPDRKLTTLEQYLLGYCRQDDLPGYLVPTVYHRFVQTQEPQLLVPILDHNEQDVLSLARLLPLIAASQ